MGSNAVQLQLSPNEVRAIYLWRRLGYGAVTFEIHAGQPVSWTGSAEGRLDKPEHPGQVELIAEKPERLSL